MLVRDTNGSSQETKHSLYMILKLYNYEYIKTFTQNYLKYCHPDDTKTQTESK